MIGLGLYCIGCVVEEFSTQLVSKLGTCLLTIARCCIMGGILVFQLLLWMVPWFSVSPSLGGEPYWWRRPVPVSYTHLTLPTIYSV